MTGTNFSDSFNVFDNFWDSEWRDLWLLMAYIFTCLLMPVLTEYEKFWHINTQVIFCG